MIADLIGLVILILCLVAVGIVIAQPLSPLLHRIEFDRVCNNYFDRMVVNSSSQNLGLTSEDISKLRNDLIDRGFTINLIDASSNTEYGNNINLTVEITREYKELRGNLTYTTKTRTMRYSNNTSGLGI